MNEEQGRYPSERNARQGGARARNLLLTCGGVGLILAGVAADRLMLRPRVVTSAPRAPIVQIVRPQPGLPSLADAVGRACPSLATVAVPASPPPPTKGAGGPEPAASAGFAISQDGWLVSAGISSGSAPVAVALSDGRRVQAAEVRTDPTSGLAVIKIGVTGLQPLVLDDQAFPRVGEFGLGVEAGRGRGCTAAAGMVAGDFLADGATGASYIRIQGSTADPPAGAPWMSADGRVTGILSDAASGTVIPGAIAAVIVDELLRNSLSPTTGFGFRAVDFADPLSSRLGNQRGRGAGIALVEPKSPAERAGIRAGDLIVAVDASPVSSASELGRAVDAAKAAATLTIVRGDQRFDVTVAREKGVQ